ncbi:MBOAT family protein [Bacteriovoracaceae bacterium]|nr:MBOAT family protein [Bacteriovoracaceae bacterium]
MLFNSLTFVVFFAALLVIYYSITQWNARKWVLLIGSYLFYAAWNPPFVILLWLSTAVDWITAKNIYLTKNKNHKRLWLFLSLLVNLGLLGFFKYGNFALESLTNFLGILGVSVSWAQLDIILPVGISFYTFQTLSYTLDIYKGKMKPTSSFLDFALYVTFFPQLVAGPIVRAIDFIPQCIQPRKSNPIQFSWGLFLMTLGLFQKVVLADVFMAPAADAVFGWNKGPLNILDSWIGTLAFSGQIFFDFAGYSTCAIGAALCLGFIIQDNFRFPYAAIGFSDFWQRWHISLSTWLRDYLYITLGGNQKGHLKTLRNLMITMFLGGLWHGASWTFVAWGALHGLYLVIERVLRTSFSKFNLTGYMGGRIFLKLVTFVLVLTTWVFFRADSFQKVSLMFASMIGAINDAPQILTTIEIYKVLSIMFLLISVHWYMRNSTLEKVMERLPTGILAVCWVTMVFSIIITQGGNNAFIYFQF